MLPMHDTVADVIYQRTGRWYRHASRHGHGWVDDYPVCPLCGCPITSDVEWVGWYEHGACHQRDVARYQRLLIPNDGDSESAIYTLPDRIQERPYDY